LIHSLQEMSLAREKHTPELSPANQPLEAHRTTGIYPVIKSTLDRLLALIGIVLLTPIILIVAILLAISNRGTPFFIQKRPGLHGKPFRLIKFKTMTDALDEHGKILPDEIRLTRIGSVIRKLSLDELPQLINVLKGEMSLIGPRPLLMEYLPLYNNEQKKRHLVKPGITGLAQVSGRNTVDWPTRFELDVYYVEHLTMWMDLKILIRTVYKVIVREGVSEEGHVTMSPFTGNQHGT
jgi:undecaprenyl phosphate N,N'-diacetylbacillosamine 1-phosphate transferase